MTSSRELTKLFEAIHDRDWSLVDTAAKAICDANDIKGHHSTARLLRGSLARNPPSNGYGADAPNNTGVIIANSLKLIRSDVRLVDVALRQQRRRELKLLIAEWQHRDSLAEHGLTPRAKLLFHGPPGVGKSMTALALGNEIGLPVYLARFDSIIGAFLGQTAAHLRQLFQFAESNPCILLFDELDALGKRRGNPLDVGELDRIVIALMQELEHARPRGLIIATTNVSTLIDDALWRRFDLSISFERPTSTELNSFARRTAKAANVKVTALLKQRLSKCVSFADVQNEILTQARRDVLKQCEANNGSRPR